MKTIVAATRYLGAQARQAGFWTCLLGGLIVLLVALLLTVALCDWQFMSPILGLSEKNAVLKYLGIGIGGVILMLQAVIANRRVKTMQQTTEAQVKTNENAEHGLRQERLKNAIEHLASPSESLRLGSTYELFHLAQDTESMRQTILDILCAHIRRTTREENYQEKYQQGPSEEMQDLLKLLFVQEHDVFTGLRINLRASWLNGADLRTARLKGADLREAKLDEATFNDASLEKADFTESHLKGASLHRAGLREADLFMAHMQGAEFLVAQMQGANIQYGNLTAAAFTYANMQGAFLAGATMYGAVLVGTRMEGANLSRTYLQGANLDTANLRGAGNHPWYRSTSFADRIRTSIGKGSDLSNLGNPGMLSEKRVNKIASELLSPETQIELKKRLQPYIDVADPPEMPANHRAILCSYTEPEAADWIAQHEAFMPADNGG